MSDMYWVTPNGDCYHASKDCAGDTVSRHKLPARDVYSRWDPCGTCVDKRLLPPGSGGAVDVGCKCPVLDNNHGRGSYKGEYILSLNCPIHSAEYGGNDSD